MAEQYIGDRYRLNRRVSPGDAARGVPELWQAADAGDLYYVKIWKRRGDDRSDIRALWNREVRNLMRLQGYPGASELFVRLHHLDADERQYYAVLDGGRRQLLSEMLANRHRYHWLQNLAEVGRRRPLWDGLLRIAEALAILHREGTLHRSLSSQSVFAGPDGQGDFRLSGFEWTLRVANSDGAATKIARSTAVRAPELDHGTEYGTATDWFDFGVLAAEVFGVDPRNHKKREPLRAAVERLGQLNTAERQLILQFLEESPEKRLCDDGAALQALRNVVRELNVATAGAGRSVVLAVRLGAEVDLARAVETAAAGEAPIDKPQQQRAWIERDLRGDIRVIARMAPVPHFVLRGEKLEYKVRQWTVDGLSTWNIGYCEAVDPMPRAVADDQYFSLGQRRLEIILYPHARSNQQSLRDRAVTWDKVFPFRQARAQLPPHLRDVHDFFRVTQQLDAALTAAQICPVEVLAVDRTSSETEIEVTPRAEPDRTELAQHLGLAPPADQVRDWFKLGAEAISTDDETDPARDSYCFLSRRTISNDANSEVVWRFAGAEPHPTGPRYRFRCQGNPPIGTGTRYLAKNYGGTIAQIRRRHKAIEDMRSHENLLRLINDPLRVSRVGLDDLPAARVPLRLDPSKVDALERLWQTQPSFAVQGPPGTGKTTLIKAFADRLLHRDPSAQVLITAHSHHTVDDVLAKLDELFLDMPEAERPIFLRIGARTDNRHDVATVTRGLLERLHGSALAERSPRFLRERLATTLAASEDAESTNTDGRTMQLLVQDAANLTFSTSNAAELADLAERGRRFDWSVIEEAGKAHGFDMAVALEESHRLLLIGDHFQLPPFNAKLFKQLLGDSLRVRKAIQAGVQFAPGFVDATIVDDDEDRASFEDRCDRWRRMVELFAVIFRESVGEDGRGPAATLTDQHRMHPDIAEIVGHTFYPHAERPDETLLCSPPETHERFAVDPPFSIRTGSWLPAARVVWCDVPWIQRKEYGEGETDGLFAAPVEARAVVDVLDELRPVAGKACDVQILSPYNDQLVEIRRAIEAAKRAGRIESMFREPFSLSHGKRLGATVDEFQGSEADVVIVSLVRNNALVPWKSVGFLKEPNRMNVLLSRAKQKLVIVGSWDFFASRCDSHTSPDAEYAYLGRMMQVMTKAERSGRLVRVGAPA